MKVSDIPILAGNSTGNELAGRIRVAILFHRFGPYHHARLNAAGQVMSVLGVEACASEDVYAWDKVEGAGAFKRVTLTDRDSNNREWRQELRRKVWQTLAENKPQVVVIPGWISADALAALAWCVKNNTPVVVMSESNAWDEPRKFWKEWVKSRLVKMCSAGLAGGTAHADYLVQLGLPRARVFLGYDIVDNEHFAKAAETVRRQNSEPSGTPEKYFLASARFVEKKNLPRLIQAFARYREVADKQKTESMMRPWDLVLLGDGPLRASIVELRAKLGLETCLHLPGFKQYDELPAYFGKAGVFVHASTTEQWGLVVNEAMASGLTVLVSNRCGCAQDLVQEAVNGFTFDPNDVEALAKLMLRVSQVQFPLTDFGAASARIVADWGPRRFGEGLLGAAHAALQSPSPKAGLMDRLLLKILLRA